MANKLVSFKRISPTPLKVKAPVIIVPKDPMGAYLAGLEAGELLKSLATTPPWKADFLAKLYDLAPRDPVAGKDWKARQLAEQVVPVVHKQGEILYKKSTTGIGFKKWAIHILPAKLGPLQPQNIRTAKVVTEWGHERNTQQQRVMEFLSVYDAEKHMDDMIASKLKRGYKRTK